MADKKCNICGRKAVWNDTYSAYCENHAPIPPSMREVRSKQRTQRAMRRPDLAEGGLDADAAFLLDLAEILSQRHVTADVAARLRQIAERLQAPLEEDRERRTYLRREKRMPAPTLDHQTLEVALNNSANYVGRLNEIGQKSGLLPSFHFVQTGPDHHPNFVCTVTFQAHGQAHKATAQAGSKAEAKQMAALKALKMLREWSRMATQEIMR